jgi:putative ABC transport system permease protein
MRHAIRSLWNTKGFTAIAVATIALGVGANTAVFSVVEAVLLRPLPFKDADRIFTLTGSNPKRDMLDATISYPQFVELSTRDRMFARLSAYTYDSFNLTDGRTARTAAWRTRDRELLRRARRADGRWPGLHNG